MVEDDPKLPPYGKPGRMLVEIEDISRLPTSVFRYSATLHDYDPDSSVFWLNEGIGVDYFLNEQVELDELGWYVFEGVVGTYYRGDGYSTDDDEEWDYVLCRRATDEEISRESFVD